jgi:hypothetical protein
MERPSTQQVGQVQQSALAPLVLLEQQPWWVAGRLVWQHLQGSRQEIPKLFVPYHSTAFHHFPVE